MVVKNIFLLLFNIEHSSYFQQKSTHIKLVLQLKLQNNKTKEKPCIELTQ